MRSDVSSDGVRPLRLRGCFRSPATIPETAIWLSCHSRSSVTLSSVAASAFVIFPSQYRSITPAVSCARLRSSSVAPSHSPRTATAGRAGI